MTLVNGFPYIPPGGAPGAKEPASGGVSRPSSGPAFRETLEELQPSRPATPSARVGLLKFSNHAIERMQSRGISFDPAQMEKIEQAVQKASAKGSKNSLLLMDDSALIVSVKDKTVVTVLDRQNMKENVFTNIDSTVVL